MPTEESGSKKNEAPEERNSQRDYAIAGKWMPHCEGSFLGDVAVRVQRLQERTRIPLRGSSAIQCSWSRSTQQERRGSSTAPCTRIQHHY